MLQSSLILSCQGGKRLVKSLDKSSSQVIYKSITVTMTIRSWRQWDVGFMDRQISSHSLHWSVDLVCRVLQVHFSVTEPLPAMSFNKRSMALGVIFMLFLLFGEALSLSGQLVNFHSCNSNQHANRAKQDYTNWKAWTIIAGTYDTSDSTIAAFVYMELFTINDVLNFHNREQFHRSVKHRLENR